MVVNRKDTDRNITWDGNTSIIPPRLTYPVQIGVGPSISPTRTGIQEIGSPSGTIDPVGVRNTQPFHTSINGNSAKHRDTTPTFSKVIGRELSHDSITNIYLRCLMNLTHNAVKTESPNFMNLGLSSVHTSDELRSFSIPATRIGRPMDGSNWLLPGHVFGEVPADRMSRTR